MTVKEAVDALLQAIVKEQGDKVSLDAIAPYNLYLCQEMGDVFIKIVVKGLRFK